MKNKDTKTKRMHILSCYAPTFAASRAEKDAFLDQLQEVLNDITPDETYIMLGTLMQDSALGTTQTIARVEAHMELVS